MYQVTKVAAATAIVGYDLLTGQYFSQLPQHRALTGIGFKGSAAAADTEIELFIDTVKIGLFRNTGTGYPNNDDIIPLEGNFIPGGSTLHAYVTEAPSTNPIFLVLIIQDV